METKRINGYYIKDDKHYPSVTTVTRAIGSQVGLMRWAITQGAYGLQQAWLSGKGPVTMDQAKEIAIGSYESELNRTATFGSDTHYLIECHLMGKEYDPERLQSLDDRTKQAYLTFKDFYAQGIFKPLYVESEVFNTDHLYAGRLDMIATIKDPTILKPYLKRSSGIPLKDKNYVVDFKTGSYHKDSHGLQLSAYAAAAIRSFGEMVEGGMIVHIERENPEKLSVQVFEREELDKYYENFLKVHAAWQVVSAPVWWKKENL